MVHELAVGGGAKTQMAENGNEGTVPRRGNVRSMPVNPSSQAWTNALRAVPRAEARLEIPGWLAVASMVSAYQRYSWVEEQERARIRPWAPCE